MPKIVDHTRRKRELIDSAWRVIARRGVTGATMRDIAAEAGFSNGALKPYFSTKHELLNATYSYVFERTNERVARVVRQRTGLAAVLAFGREVLPIDETRRDEARVVIAFWQEAALDPVLARANSESMQVWREWIGAWLDEAREAGTLRPEVRTPVATQTLVAFLQGAQVLACLDSAASDPEEFVVQLESLVDSWRYLHNFDSESLPV